MTSEDREREIEDYVRYLDLLYDEIFSVVPRKGVRLWVVGFSQGTATVARWVARGKVDPDRVVLWAGLLPPELTAQDAAALARRARSRSYSGGRTTSPNPIWSRRRSRD